MILVMKMLGTYKALYTENRAGIPDFVQGVKQKMYDPDRYSRGTIARYRYK